MVLSDSLYCNETLGNLEQFNFFSLLVLSGAKTPFQAIKYLKHNKIIIIITEKFCSPQSVPLLLRCCCGWFGMAAARPGPTSPKL